MSHHRFSQCLKFVSKIIALGAFAFPAIPLQWLFVRFNVPAQKHLPVLFHRYAAFVIGLRVHVHGAPANHRPLMLISSHVSWLDIVALSSICPISFIAKSEVAGWGIFGLFAKLQRSVFVDRQRRIATKKVNSIIASRLKDGDVMVLFGEGTTNDGCKVYPFKSSLIGVAGEVDGLNLQPVSIAYTKLNGMPAGRFERVHTAWYGDMDLLPSLRAVFMGGAIDVTISFGENEPFEANQNRKLMAKKLEETCRRMTYEAHMGRQGFDGSYFFPLLQIQKRE
jgi:lyso-ornithine lipid O-acyltransferase